MINLAISFGPSRQLVRTLSLVQLSPRFLTLVHDGRCEVEMTKQAWQERDRSNFSRSPRGGFPLQHHFVPLHHFRNSHRNCLHQKQGPTVVQKLECPGAESIWVSKAFR